MAKTVRDIIKDRKEVYCISNQTTAAEAARFLKDHGIRAAGVCNLSGKVVGVDSQSDISDKKPVGFTTLVGFYVVLTLGSAHAIRSIPGVVSTSVTNVKSRPVRLS